jgi:uncharacterized protein with von Willebrand factor type A (vWA) domain
MAFLDLLNAAPHERSADARNRPLALVSRDFARHAATMALLLAVTDISPIASSMPPVVRLKFIVYWSALMTVLDFFVKRARLARTSPAQPR